MKKIIELLNEGYKELRHCYTERDVLEVIDRLDLSRDIEYNEPTHGMDCVVMGFTRIEFHKNGRVWVVKIMKEVTLENWSDEEQIYYDMSTRIVGFEEWYGCY